MKSKLLYNVFALVMLTAAMSSCEKMTLSESVQSENDNQGNVVLRVIQFEQTPFDSKTRADVGSVCSRLCFHIYDENGIRVTYTNQKDEDSNFGTASFSLGEGRYILVVVGHSASSNPSFSANEKVSISGSNLGDTFWCCEEFEVGDEEVELSLRLKRIVSLLRFIPSDDKPNNMNQMIFSYKGWSQYQFAILYAIESGPKESHRLVDGSTHVGHHCNGIFLAFYQRPDLRRKQTVFFYFR